MTTTELLALFRDEVVDLSTPLLFSDSLVYGYIDEAQKQFCRDTWGIEDARSFKVVTVVDTEWYRYDQRILRLLGATESGDNVPITTVEESPEIKFDGRKGRTLALVKGLQKNFLRVWPIPSEVKTIELRTLRLSTDVAAGDDLEIDEQHHRALVLWVKYKAYGKHDSDLFDGAKAAQYYQEFKTYCEEAKRAQGRLRRHVAVVQFRDV
jgi:hypothetical protein